MAFGIKLADANFSNYIARAVPYLSDTEGVFIFGGSAAISQRNLSPNVAAGTTGSYVGGGAAGTFADNSATLNITYSLDTGLQYAGLNKTVVSVSEFSTATHSAVVAPQLRLSIFSGAFRPVGASAGYMGGSGDSISQNVPLFMAMTSGDGTGNDTSYLGVGSGLDTNTLADAAVTSGAIVFGPKDGDGSADTTFNKHYLGLVYNRELTGAEMANVYAWASEYMAARGLLLV